MVTLRGENIFYQTCFSLYSKLKKASFAGFHPSSRETALCLVFFIRKWSELWKALKRFYINHKICLSWSAHCELSIMLGTDSKSHIFQVSWSVWVFWTLGLLLAKISFLLEEAEACSVFLLFYLACINIVRTVHILYFDRFLGWGTEFGWYCERSVTCVFLYFVMLPNGLS